MISSPPLISGLNRLCRRFRGVILSHERNSSRNKPFGDIREIRSSISLGLLRPMQEISPKFEISTSKASQAPSTYLSARVFERAQCSYQELFSSVVPTFESNIAYTLRFMIDTKVVGMNWIEVPAGNYTVAHAKKSKCQIEFFVRYVSLWNIPCARVEGGTDGTNSYRIPPKANGLRSPPSGYSVLILSAPVGRVFSRRPIKIQ